MSPSYFKTHLTKEIPTVVILTMIKIMLYILFIQIFFIKKQIAVEVKILNDFNNDVCLKTEHGLHEKTCLVIMNRGKESSLQKLVTHFTYMR